MAKHSYWFIVGLETPWNEEGEDYRDNLVTLKMYKRKNPKDKIKIFKMTRQTDPWTFICLITDKELDDVGFEHWLTGWPYCFCDGVMNYLEKRPEGIKFVSDSVAYMIKDYHNKYDETFKEYAECYW